MELNVHSETSHIEKLKKLCRVCCERCLTIKQKLQGKKVYLCSDFKREILLIFNLHIDSDKYDSHSPNMCFNCVNKLRNKTYSVSNARLLANSTKDIWTPFKANQDCALCNFFDASSAGAIFSRKRGKKQKHVYEKSK